MIRIYFLFIFTSGLFAQVGINTTDPDTTLDINGDLTIRSVDLETDLPLAKNYILISNAGLVKRIPLKSVFNETYKTMIKGNFSSAIPVSVSLLSGPEIIPFDNVEFDVNNEFDTTTHTFTAKETGVYEIEAYIKTEGITVASNYGIRLLKNSTILHTDSYANVSAALINVTPPTRSIRSIIALNANDTITFELECSIAVISLLKNGKECSYFLIKRVR